MEAESENYFYASNSIIIKNVSELKTALEGMDENTFNHHVNEERNDFSEWINHAIGDKKLAKKLRKAPSKQVMVRILDGKLEKVEEKEKVIESVEKDIHHEEQHEEQHKEIMDIPLQKIQEVLDKEKEIGLREKKILEVEERIEKQLTGIKQPKSFFTKEFVQGIAVGFLFFALVALIYIKFFL